MLRWVTTVGAVAVLTVLWTALPTRADHSTDHTIEQMTAHYQNPDLETQNKPFALLYLRTTEGMGMPTAPASSPTRSSGTKR